MAWFLIEQDICLHAGEWSASRPGRFTSRERAPGTHCIGGWVGPRAVLDAVGKRKIPSPSWESNLRTPIVQPLAQCYTDRARQETETLLVAPVTLLTELRAGRPGFYFRQGKGFSFSLFTASSPALGPTQLPIQWVPRALSLGVKRPGREAERSPPSRAEVKNAWCYASTLPYVFMG
jgi:hypothetical protein